MKPSKGRGSQGFYDRLRRTRLGRKIRFMRRPRIRFPRVPSALAVAALIAFSVFVMSGGVYVQIEKSGLALQIGERRISVIYPGLSAQTSGEAYLVASLLTLGMGGFLVCLLGVRYAYRARYARIVLFIGLSLIVVSFYLLWEIAQAKWKREPWPMLMDLWRTLSLCP